MSTTFVCRFFGCCLGFTFFGLTNLTSVYATQPTPTKSKRSLPRSPKWEIMSMNDFCACFAEPGRAALWGSSNGSVLIFRPPHRHTWITFQHRLARPALSSMTSFNQLVRTIISLCIAVFLQIQASTPSGQRLDKSSSEEVCDTFLFSLTLSNLNLSFSYRLLLFANMTWLTLLSRLDVAWLHVRSLIMVLILCYLIDLKHLTQKLLGA